MKHSMKSYDSFQDELEDYIKVQQARGLEPKTCFRKMREDYLETYGYRKVCSTPRVTMFDQRLPSGTVQTYRRSCNNISHTEDRVPQWLPAPDCRPRLESQSHYQFPRDFFSERPVSLNLSQQEYDYASSRLESGGHKHPSSGSKPSAHEASHKQGHQKRRRRPEEGREKPKDEQPKHKRKRSSEESELDHKSVQRKREKLGSPEGLKTRKEKKSRDIASKKEERKRRKERKEEGKERTDEEMLWDQSILGY
ncbi:lysine-rich coiled-coil protein 1 [Ctenodactylus gundi]